MNIKQAFILYTQNALIILKKENSYYYGGTAQDGKEETIEDLEKQLNDIEKGTYEPTIEDLIYLFSWYEDVLLNNLDIIERNEIIKHGEKAKN